MQNLQKESASSRDLLELTEKKRAGVADSWSDCPFVKDITKEL